MPTRARILRHARAALVALHLVAITLAAIPAPEGGMGRGAWSDPGVQAEFAVWARRLHTTPANFEARLWTLAQGYMGVREQALRPVRPYLEVTGTEQPWRMFVAPHRFPARFQVQVLRERDVMRGDDERAWETLFEERSAEHRWHAAFLAHDRMRPALFRYAWPDYRGDADEFCDWLAGWAFYDFADAAAVRCRFYKARSPSPEEVLAHRQPEGSWTQEHRVARRATEAAQ